MSLDVMLYKNYHISYDGGKTLEPKQEEVYSANITHNLGKMAEEAEIYEALWRPHKLKKGYNVPENDHHAEYEYECSTTTLSNEIIPIIEKGLIDLKSRPKHFKKFNSPNGWGMYDNFVPFVENYLNALKEYPEAEVIISR
jgi:hypothetical protein